MIRTVIFDLGGVIVPFDFKRAYAALAAISPLSPAEIPQRISATGLVPRFESGQIQSEPFVAELCRALDLHMSFEDFENLWSSIFLPDTLIPASLLETIRARYRLLLLSNTNALHFRMLRESYPLLSNFHHYVLSYEVGAMKPSPLIYREAIAQAQCAPHECFFTDDIPAYVEGARREGIDAVQFQSCDQIIQELRTRGIQI